MCTSNEKSPPYARWCGSSGFDEIAPSTGDRTVVCKVVAPAGTELATKPRNTRHTVATPTITRDAVARPDITVPSQAADVPYRHVRSLTLADWARSVGTVTATQVAGNLACLAGPPPDRSPSVRVT